MPEKSSHVPELLAPAGNLEKLKIAVSFGADAVYLAGPRFSLRAGSDNFSEVELKDGVAFAHQNNCKVYVTLNAFLHDEEMELLPEYVHSLAKLSIDAVIASDLGVIETVKKHSKIAVHLSTQASCLNKYAAQLWKNLGIKRIVLGREVSIRQAMEIRESAGCEVEMFVHGAMCMAYSGNCTISNYTHARDSNRGGCVQSCRFAYSIWNRAFQREEEKESGLTANNASVNLMSSKDLNGIHQISNFVKSGIDSLKIEGRMKSNLYVASTVQAYSQAIKLSNYEETNSQKLVHYASELGKFPHRQYTEASLMSPAGKNSIFLNGDRMGKASTDYEIAGTVIEVHPKKNITLLVQIPFDRNTSLEFLTFNGQTISVPTAQMMDIHQTPISKAKSNTLVLLPFAENIQKLNLARKPTEK